MYTLKLLLEDATGQLDAILFGADADIFFAGLPACNLGADANAARQLLDALQRLVGKDCTRSGCSALLFGVRAAMSGVIEGAVVVV